MVNNHYRNNDIYDANNASSNDSPYFPRQRLNSYGTPSSDFSHAFAGAEGFTHHSHSLDNTSFFPSSALEHNEDALFNSVATIHGGHESQVQPYVSSSELWTDNSYVNIGSVSQIPADFSQAQFGETSSSYETQSLLSPSRTSYSQSTQSIAYSHDGSASNAFDRGSSPTPRAHRPGSIASLPRHSSNSGVKKRRPNSDPRHYKRPTSFSASASGEQQAIPEEDDSQETAALRMMPQDQTLLTGMRFADGAIPTAYPSQETQTERRYVQRYSREEFKEIWERDPNIARNSTSELYKAEKTLCIERGTSLFICPKCLEEFDARSQYTKHLDKHFKPFKCPGCENVPFSSTATYYRHLREFHHPESKLYYCQYTDCDRHETANPQKPFPREANRNDHHRRTHKTKKEGAGAAVSPASDGRRGKKQQHTVTESPAQPGVEHAQRIETVMLRLHTLHSLSKMQEIGGLGQALDNIENLLDHLDRGVITTAGQGFDGLADDLSMN